MTSMKDETPQVKVVEPKVNTVGVFVTYTRHEPYPAAEWAKLMEFALKTTMEPVQVEAITATAIEQDTLSQTLHNANKVVNQFVMDRNRRVELLKMWPDLHHLLEQLGGKTINDVVALQLTDPATGPLAAG